MQSATVELSDEQLDGAAGGRIIGVVDDLPPSIGIIGDE